MWSPPSVVTLPGHQGTLGLRIRRALVRMKRNETRKAAKTNRTDDWVDPDPLMLMLSAAIGRPSSHAAGSGERVLRTFRHEPPERRRRGVRRDQRPGDRLAVPRDHLALRSRLDLGNRPRLLR